MSWIIASIKFLLDDYAQYIYPSQSNNVMQPWKTIPTTPVNAFITSIRDPSKMNVVYKMYIISIKSLADIKGENHNK